MVALVVAGLLMGVLVGLSGAVQRSFGYSKEITELQANMRFAMKTLVDDFARVAFMSSPDPVNDSAHEPEQANDKCPPAPPGMEAMTFNAGSGLLALRGNYISTRDYLRKMFTGQILCRNYQFYDGGAAAGSRCGAQTYELSHEPFADGPGRIQDVFCPGQVIRLDAEGDGHYCYYHVGNVDLANNAIGFQENVNRNMIAGEDLWFSPITQVQYQLVQSATPPPRYAVGTAARFNWVLQRSMEGCRNSQLTLGQPVEIAESLLPQAMGGFTLDQIMDTAGMANLSGVEWQPAIGVNPGDVDPLVDPVDVVRIRAVVITLRGRLESEDPEFTIQGYTSNPPFLNFGVDLDGQPTNGLARVRVERTVVDMRNLSL